MVDGLHDDFARRQPHSLCLDKCLVGNVVALAETVDLLDTTVLDPDTADTIAGADPYIAEVVLDDRMNNAVQ